MRKIITTFVHPPIPDRSHDWVAHYEGDCEDYEHQDPVGHGATEQEAIDNFKQYIEENKPMTALQQILELMKQLTYGEVVALKDHTWDVAYAMTKTEQAKLKELL